MKVIDSVKITQNACFDFRKKGLTVGFVPTMGALHEGHLSLIRQSIRDNDKTVVSIFVNPKQFGKNEDLSYYPRPINKDLYLCRKAGVDIVFSPCLKDMYAKDFRTKVSVEELGDSLCGEVRPGHFIGVATVVVKLFNIVGPDIAYFGQKDAQQAAVIKQLIKDLDFSVKLKVMPIVRENDGLALSSRNVYLNKQQRKDALILSQSLELAKGLVKNGTSSTKNIVGLIKKNINSVSSAKIDYVEIVQKDSLIPLKRVNNNAMLLLAVWIGKTRLIDNAILN